VKAPTDVGPALSGGVPQADAENATSPNVTSQPLGKKPKKTVRKGFIVMIVIILGFFCGAVLASYVLPVDEYVAKARAMMDKKFNPGSVVEMAPALPTAPPMASASVQAPSAPMAPRHACRFDARTTSD